jgi:hypothetical protein
MNPTSLVKDEKVCHSEKQDGEATSLKNIALALPLGAHHYSRKTKSYEL